MGRFRGQPDANEIKRLYIDEGLSMPVIAKMYGVSRQAVHERLHRAGIPTRKTTLPPGPRTWEIAKLKVNVAEIIRQYSEELMSLCETGRRHNIKAEECAKILQSEGIKLRKHLIGVWKKYRALHELEIGESTAFDLTGIRHPHTRLYGTARRSNFRVSVSRVENGIYKVTRVA